MISFRDATQALRAVQINPSQPVIVHASLSTVGEIRGGAETLLGALLSASCGVLVPTFTYQTMIIPEVGPENNACAYGTGKESNRSAEFFAVNLPADPSMGVLAETIRKAPHARRSEHPILSFAGIGVDTALEAQTLNEPLSPIGVLAHQDALVLLIGVDHTANISIHYAERLAGRKQFLRWALTPQGVRECPGIPGCSDGFEQAAAYLKPFTRSIPFGDATLQAVPLAALLETLTPILRQEPLALLCSKGDERCAAVRQDVAARGATAKQHDDPSAALPPLAPVAPREEEMG